MTIPELKPWNGIRQLAAAALIAVSVVPALGQSGDAISGEKLFKKCASCHRVGEGAKNATGPVLNGVVGRPAGSFEGYKYGKGVKAANAKGLVWTEELIFDWLAGPKDFLRTYTGDPKAKSKISFRLKDEQQRRDVIAYLASLSPTKAAASGMGVSHGDTPFDETMASGEVDPLASMERVRQ